MSERRTDLKSLSTIEDLPFGQPNHIWQVTEKLLEGWTEVNGRVAKYAQENMKSNLHNIDLLRQSKTPQEFFENQNKLAKDYFDEVMVQSRELSELIIKITKDAVAK